MRRLQQAHWQLQCHGLLQFMFLQQPPRPYWKLSRRSVQQLLCVLDATQTQLATRACCVFAKLLLLARFRSECKEQRTHGVLTAAAQLGGRSQKSWVILQTASLFKPAVEHWLHVLAHRCVLQECIRNYMPYKPRVARHWNVHGRTQSQLVVREMLDGAVAMGREVLASLGTPETMIDAIEAEYRRRDLERLDLQLCSGDIMSGADTIIRGALDLDEAPDPASLGEIPPA